MQTAIWVAISNSPLKAVGGVLVLLIAFGLSWVAVNRRASEFEARGEKISLEGVPKVANFDSHEEPKDIEDYKTQDTTNISVWKEAHVAAENGDLAKLRIFILERGLHVDAEDEQAMTILQVASRHGHLEVVRFLVNEGAAVNAIETDNRAALHFAIIRGHVPVARFLLEHGADVHLRKRLGLTPMHVAVQSWRTEFVRLLLEHGADIDAPDDRGDTPLDWAITYGSGLMVQTLLDLGAVLRDRDADGKEPMERAVKGWDLLKVDVLASKGQRFPTNSKDRQKVMMLYAMKQSQTNGETTEASSGA